MIELLRNRRSARKYKPQRIEPEKAELLKEALLRSPTSKRINHPEFVFVDEKPLLSELSRAKPHGSSFLENAALAIVVCGNEKRSDVWVEDCSIASILVQMTALSLGIGSCWVQIRLRQHGDTGTAEQHVQSLLGIPQHMRVESIIALGYPDQENDPISGDQLKGERIHSNRY